MMDYENKRTKKYAFFITPITVIIGTKTNSLGGSPLKIRKDEA